MTNAVKGKALVDFENIIADVHQAGFNEGEKIGRKNEADEFEQSMEREFEKRNYEFTATQFADCETLQDFTEKLKEITLRSYNFMT